MTGAVVAEPRPGRVLGQHDQPRSVGGEPCGDSGEKRIVGETRPVLLDPCHDRSSLAVVELPELRELLIVELSGESATDASGEFLPDTAGDAVAKRGGQVSQTALREEALLHR